MFTGIIEAQGELSAIARAHDAARLSVTGIPEIMSDAGLGDSIAVDGVCLTVTNLLPGGFSADVMAETLRLTTLGELKEGQRLNIERAMRADTRLGGHMVQGHVDGGAELLAREPGVAWEDFLFSCGKELGKYIAHKGAICLNGVSLTVTGVEDRSGSTSFGVSLIPTTLRQTNLGTLRPGDRVNVEADVVAKYIERLTEAAKEEQR